jgi:hypothetical protein
LALVAGKLRMRKTANGVLLAVVLVDTYLLYLFFVKAGKGRGVFAPSNTILLGRQ